MNRLPAPWLDARQGVSHYLLQLGWVRCPSLGWSALDERDRATARLVLKMTAIAVPVLALVAWGLAWSHASSHAVFIGTLKMEAGLLALMGVPALWFVLPALVFAPLLARQRADAAWFPEHCERWLCAHQAGCLSRSLPPALAAPARSPRI